MLSRDSEDKMWCDLCLNLRYDFGRMNSTLGSVVPLAMFQLINLITIWKIHSFNNHHVWTGRYWDLFAKIMIDLMNQNHCCKSYEIFSQEWLVGLHKIFWGLPNGILFQASPNGSGLEGAVWGLVHRKITCCQGIKGALWHFELQHIKMQ